MAARTTKPKANSDATCCPLYTEHTSLKKFSIESREMSQQNRDMIEKNHSETLAIIGGMNKTHSEDLAKIRETMSETNDKFDRLNETIERTGRIFAWWDSLPKKIRFVSKSASIIVAIMGGVTVIITFFEKITGN